MTIPEYPSYALTTTGYGYYRVHWRDVPSRDDFVVVGGVRCRVLMVVDEDDGESRVWVGVC